MIEYPKCKYNNPNGPESCVVVNSREEEDALGPEYKDHWLECEVKSDVAAESAAQESTEQSEAQSSSGESVAPITIVEMTKAQLIDALRALGQTANATMSKDALTEKLQKAQSQE